MYSYFLYSVKLIRNANENANVGTKNKVGRVSGNKKQHHSCLRLIVEPLQTLMIWVHISKFT